MESSKYASPSAVSEVTSPPADVQTTSRYPPIEQHSDQRLDEPLAASTADTVAPIMDAAPAHDTMQAMTAAAPMAVYDADQFAQTVETDDLFDDDFEPLAEPTVEQPAEPVQPPTQPQHIPNTPRSQRPPRGPYSRRQAAPSGPAANGAGEAPLADLSTSPTAHSKSAPAVRGDRSLTGGAARTKLTDEELSAKIEAMKLKNTALEEAHARATADEASFRAGEQVARERARKERQERQAMMGEREKNRERKLKSMKSRDWDMEKPEHEEKRGGSRRGAHGGVVGGVGNGGGGRGVEGWLDDQAQHAALEGVPEAPEAGRGGPSNRAARGRGRGRGGGGRGRGGAPGADRPNPSKTPTGPSAPPKPADFPALPQNADKPQETKPSDPKLQPKEKDQGLQATKVEDKPWGSSTAKSPKFKGPSWADEMEDR